ncbi:MAG: nitrophenyl compound nitroreductase subunit ArsF family protein [Candidatus Omnitrophica bacterium]|nr:nitrophenyl compound nitroreductase subunit ArsF family protein [Candidatus Omnitrophota bacterium]
MRKLLFSAILASFFVAFCPIADADNTSNKVNANVIVYYFHGNFRCPTCHKLEQYTKEAIESSYKDELSSGKLVFKVVNAEEKENEHYMKDYGLYTRSVVLSLVKDGKEIRYKNLDKIWDYVGDKQKFFDYIKSETNDFLKDLQ